MDIALLILLIIGTVIGIAGLAIIVYWALPQPYPALTESDYSHHQTPWWQLYYCHKYLRPKRRPYKGAGLNRYFKDLRFHFDTPVLTNSRQMTIGAVGDIMCRKDLAGDGAEFLFDGISDRLFSNDITIGNLEFSVNPNTYYDKLLRYAVPYSYALPLLGDKNGNKFDVVSCANNHINDSSHEGISQTCDFLDSIGMKHTGANRTPEEQDEILMLERDGIKIAVLSYTFSTNNLPLETGHEFGTNLVRFNALSDEDYDPSLILRHINLAKDAGADYIIACNHWGIDLEIYPPARLVKRAHDLLDAGLDLIIGHHPHVLGQIDRHQTPDGRDTLVLYSLGNMTTKGLIFPIQRLGAIARITLSIGTDESGKQVVTPTGIEMTPTFFNLKGRGPERRGYIRNLKQTIDRMNKKNRNLDLTLRERIELRIADKMYIKYFESNENGIIHR